MCPVVTIDGPVASGKTSVSRELARRLGWSWVSTGSFYRGLAYVAQQMAMDLRDEASLSKLVISKDWAVKMSAEATQVYFRGQDVSQEILKEKVGAIASQISQFQGVRKSLLEPQRDCRRNQVGLVAEGRDCGSVVFPDALVKIYLTARSEARAERRAKQSGDDVEKVQETQATRDQQDRGRAVAPLQIPEGAEVVDTSGLGFDEVVARVESLVRKHLGSR